MSILTTESFDLAVYTAGQKDAARGAILIPGRLDTKDYAHMTGMANCLASLDYYVIGFDPPGNWESPDDISHYSTTNTLKAVDELLKLLDRPTVMAGHSRGGTNAMLAAIRHPEQVSNLITVMSQSGPSKVNIPKEGEEIVVSERDLPPGDRWTDEKKEFLLTMDYFNDQAQYDATPELGKLLMPKLFIYGSRDTIIPNGVVQRAYELAADPKEIHEVDAEHDYRRDKEAMDAVNGLIASFVLRHSRSPN